VYQEECLKAVMFGFGVGQELSEHTVSMPAVMHFLWGEADVTRRPAAGGNGGSVGAHAGGVVPQHPGKNADRNVAFAAQAVSSSCCVPLLLRGISLGRFVSTIRFAEQGIKSIHETTRRAASFKSAAKKLGVKVLDIYWSLGPFDGLLIFEAPDSQTATAAMLDLDMQGNVTKQTAEIYSAAEMEKLLKRVGVT
jgi:uncharacterized protein with GYD domain